MATPKKAGSSATTKTAGSSPSAKTAGPSATAKTAGPSATAKTASAATVPAKRATRKAAARPARAAAVKAAAATTAPATVEPATAVPPEPVAPAAETVVAGSPATVPQTQPEERAWVATDAAYAPASLERAATVRNVSEVRHLLRTNATPVVFVGATPFNLLGLDRWVRNFSYVTYYDGWDGAHPRVFTPKDKPYVEFTSGEDINNWLLRNEEVRAFIAERTPEGARPKVAMVFFDEETEQICQDAGWDLILPPAALRHRLDSKLVTTRLADEVGVPSVPNTITTVRSWAGLKRAAVKAGLGSDLVVQSAYGDSGKTTFFIDGPESFRAHQEDLVGHEVKVMRRIVPMPIAVEAVLTSSGTIVGPFMSELTGHPELTPYRGGWCGNEMFPTVLSDAARDRATEMVRRLGDRLGQEGYRGFFEVDVLLDTADDEVYLGELNPRISGASAITNVTAGAYADVPLFLFHLLEYLDVQVDLDVDEINARWRRLASSDEWSQMIVKEVRGPVEHIDAAAPTGQYALNDDGTMTFRRAALDWHQLQDEQEAFYLRIYGAGDYRWKGADLGVIVTKGRLQHEVDGELRLTERAVHLIDAVRGRYAGTPVETEVAEVDVVLPLVSAAK